MRNVLLISPESWDSHWVSKHHYAIEMARRGIDVYFLDPPTKALPFAALFGEIDVEAVSGHRGIHIVRSGKALPGITRLGRWIGRFAEKRWLSRLEKKLGTKVDTIWLFENSRFYDMRFAGSRLRIYHQVDYNQSFAPAEAAQSANICYCTSDYILQDLLKNNRRSYKIHHGLARRKEGAQLTREQLQLLTEVSVNVVYVGNLTNDSDMNVPILEAIVDEYPCVCFHLIGESSPETELWKRLSGKRNVRWWGKVESELIPIILNCASVLLIIYTSDRLREQLSSPHKMMEYLNSGKVIVATYMDEYKDKRDLLVMVDRELDFLNAFREVMENLERYNSDEGRLKRIRFALDNTYEKQLDRIIDLIGEDSLCRR